LKGESTMRFVKIEIEAKLILTIPSAKDDEKAEDFVLAAERHINDGELMTMCPGKDKPASSGTLVGIRIHTKDFKVLT